MQNCESQIVFEEIGNNLEKNGHCVGKILNQQGITNSEESFYFRLMENEKIGHGLDIIILYQYYTRTKNVVKNNTFFHVSLMDSEKLLATEVGQISNPSRAEEKPICIFRQIFKTITDVEGKILRLLLRALPEECAPFPSWDSLRRSLFQTPKQHPFLNIRINCADLEDLLVVTDCAKHTTCHRIVLQAKADRGGFLTEQLKGLRHTGKEGDWNVLRLRSRITTDESLSDFINFFYVERFKEPERQEQEPVASLIDHLIPDRMADVILLSAAVGERKCMLQAVRVLSYGIATLGGGSRPEWSLEKCVEALEKISGVLDFNWKENNNLFLHSWITIAYRLTTGSGLSSSTSPLVNNAWIRENVSAQSGPENWNPPVVEEAESDQTEEDLIKSFVKKWRTQNLEDSAIISELHKLNQKSALKKKQEKRSEVTLHPEDDPTVRKKSRPLYCNPLLKKRTSTTTASDQKLKKITSSSLSSSPSTKKCQPSLTKMNEYRQTFDYCKIQEAEDHPLPSPPLLKECRIVNRRIKETEAQIKQRRNRKNPAPSAKELTSSSSSSIIRAPSPRILEHDLAMSPSPTPTCIEDMDEDKRALDGLLASL